MEEKEKGLVTYESRDGQEIRLSFDTVRKYLVSGKPEFVTDQEIVLYMGMCKARGLNPFKRDCYLVKYTQSDPAATIVSIDYFRSRAKAQVDCVGWKSGIIIMGDDGKPEYRNGAFISEGENLVGGWFRAKPKNWEEQYEWTISLKPYIKKTGTGAVTRFWSEENQPYMIAKVAESQGLRRLWPDEFQGIFTEDEVQPRDVTPQEEPLKIPQPIKEEKNVPTAQPEPQGEGDPGVEGARQPLAGKPESPTVKDKAYLLNWIANEATKDDLLATENEVTRNLKGKSSQEQVDICREWNRRKKELLADAKS